MPRYRKEIWADISALLSLEEWTDDDAAQYQTLFDEYPNETEEDAVARRSFEAGVPFIQRV